MKCERQKKYTIGSNVTTILMAKTNRLREISYYQVLADHKQTRSRAVRAVFLPILSV